MCPILCRQLPFRTRGAVPSCLSWILDRLPARNRLLQRGRRRILVRTKAVAFLALIISEVMAGVLLWAGVEKARDLRPVTGTLQRLGVHVGKARVGAAFLLLAELGVG